MRPTGDGRVGVGLVFMLGGLVMIQEARHRCDGGVKSGRSSWVVLHKVTVGAATFLGFAGPPDRSPARHLDDRAGDDSGQRAVILSVEDPAACGPLYGADGPRTART